MSQTRYASYADLTNPALKDAINRNCLSTIHFASLVAEFAQTMSVAFQTFANEIQTITSTFRRKGHVLNSEWLLDTPSTIYCAWEKLISETEMDAQSHLDAAVLLVKNVSEPLYEVAKYKRSQAEKLQAFREHLEHILDQSEKQFRDTEDRYMDAYGTLKNCGSLESREGLRHEFHNAHNKYILQICASNRIIDEFQQTVPQVLEELDEISIDTSNTINMAIESQSLLLLTKAREQQRQLENLLKCCRQVNPQLDISYFVKAVSSEESNIAFQKHRFCPADYTASSIEHSAMNHLILDRVTEVIIRDKRAALQKEALELTSFIKQNQDISHALMNMCQRNLANHLYAKVYETQEDLCRKRNEIRVANAQLGAVRAQIDLLTPKQNGSVEDDQDKKNPSTIRGMWKKAFKTLKNSSSLEKISRKSGSFYKKKQNSKEADEEVESVNAGSVDPVYSLLKCAADLPRVGGRSPCLLHPHCSGLHTPGYSRYHSGGDSSDSASKASSPSSSDVTSSTAPQSFESLGSDFKKIYKLTSPGKKTPSVFDNVFPL